MKAFVLILVLLLPGCQWVEVRVGSPGKKRVGPALLSPDVESEKQEER
jgi:hypothetical protein